MNKFYIQGVPILRYDLRVDIFYGFYYYFYGFNLFCFNLK